MHSPLRMELELFDSTRNRIFFRVVVERETTGQYAVASAQRQSNQAVVLTRGQPESPHFDEWFRLRPVSLCDALLNHVGAAAAHKRMFPQDLKLRCVVARCVRRRRTKGMRKRVNQ